MLSKKLDETLKVVQEMEIDMKKKAIESENVYEDKSAENDKVSDKVSSKGDKQNEPDIKPVALDSKAEGELGLISTVLGCRENRDRIEFAEDLKEYARMLDLSKEKREEISKKRFTLASDYKLTLSEGLMNYLKHCKIADLAHAMPKYEFISPSLALIIMAVV